MSIDSLKKFKKIYNSVNLLKNNNLVILYLIVLILNRSTGQLIW